MESKEELIKKILDNKNVTTNARNRMGCSEDWYNPYFAIANTFTEEELKNMELMELLHLKKLANELTRALY